MVYVSHVHEHRYTLLIGLLMMTVSFCMFGFGLVMICQGLVSNWGGLMTTRWFLGMKAIHIHRHKTNRDAGMFETGMFPGCRWSLSKPE